MSHLCALTHDADALGPCKNASSGPVLTHFLTQLSTSASLLLLLHNNLLVNKTLFELAAEDIFALVYHYEVGADC